MPVQGWQDVRGRHSHGLVVTHFETEERRPKLSRPLDLLGSEVDLIKGTLTGEDLSQGGEYDEMRRGEWVEGREHKAGQQEEKLEHA